MSNCNPTAESETLLNHFHNEDIEKRQHVFTLSILLTVLTIASAILFITVKLKLCARYQTVIQNRQSQ